MSIYPHTVKAVAQSLAAKIAPERAVEIAALIEPELDRLLHEAAGVSLSFDPAKIERLVWRYCGGEGHGHSSETWQEAFEEQQPYAKLGMDLLDEAKDRVSEGQMGEEDEHVMELAAEHGAGNVQRVPYDPAKHGPIDAEPGDLIWYWGGK